MIYIGTSGFSYDDWVGEFYPKRTAKKDMLNHYASNFDAVEINSTYYAIPAAASFESMVHKTPDDFRFVVKAHQDMTHAEQPDATTFDAFLGSIQPLQDANKLGCILAQYPWSFKHNQDNIDQLYSFKDQIGDIPTVIEFRNADWANDETFQLLEELDFGFCCVDEPQLKGLMPRTSIRTSPIGYVRFHGRNSKKWWKHDESYERYDYLYSEEELSEWVPKIEEINCDASDTYLFFNNHYHAKSVQNARMFARMLGVQLPVQSDSHSDQLSLLDDI